MPPPSRRAAMPLPPRVLVRRGPRRATSWISQRLAPSCRAEADAELLLANAAAAPAPSGAPSSSIFHEGVGVPGPARRLALPSRSRSGTRSLPALPEPPGSVCCCATAAAPLAPARSGSSATTGSAPPAATGARGSMPMSVGARVPGRTCARPPRA
nr:unnamed protein product [Digitaria exilis]